MVPIRLFLTVLGSIAVLPTLFPVPCRPQIDDVRLSPEILAALPHALGQVELFDLLGKHVDRLTSSPGDRIARFPAAELRSGTYLVRARYSGSHCSFSISHVLR